MPRKAVESSGARKAINTKITDDTRAGLEMAAKQNDRTLSGEIEFRLEQSLKDNRNSARPHDVTLADMVLMVAGETDWRSSRAKATYAFTRIKMVLAAFMGAVDDPAMVEHENAFGRALGIEPADKAAILEARAKAVQDEGEMLKNLDDRSVRQWRSTDKPQHDPSALPKPTNV